MSLVFSVFRLGQVAIVVHSIVRNESRPERSIRAAFFSETLDKTLFNRSVSVRKIMV
jgi:hypothetical protein